MSGATHAIPTTWNGIQFRSRLEARWASFFTKLGWEWSYEPIDLKGYIPDFLLHMRRDVLIEVKPFTTFEDLCITDARDKIHRSGWLGPCGVVGSRFTGFWVGPDLVVHGACTPTPTDRDSFARSGRIKTAALSPACDRTYCLSCGGRSHNCLSLCANTPHDLVLSWNEAGNEVQWLGRGRRA